MRRGKGGKVIINEERRMKREDKQVEGMINVFSLIFEGLGK